MTLNIRLAALGAVLTSVLLAAAGCSDDRERTAAGGDPADAEVADSAAASAAMDSVYAGFTRAYAAADPDSVVALYTDEPLYLPSRGDVRTGREALRREFSFLEAIGERGDTPRIEFTILRRAVGEDVAYDVGYYELRVESADGGVSPPSRGKFVTAWRRGEDGRWRIDVDGFSQAPPAER